MAALTATQALDPTALALGAPPRLLPDEADQLARQYLAQNWPILQHPRREPFGRRRVRGRGRHEQRYRSDHWLGCHAPTVSIRLAAPVHISLLSVAGLPTTISLTLVGSAAART